MPKTQSLIDLGLRGEFSSVAAALKVKGLHIFSTPAKYINPLSSMILIHSIGGMCQKGEQWQDALMREISEELGVEAAILSSPSAKLITSEGFQTKIIVSDQPNPYCVYQRTKEDDISFYTPNVRWMIGYRATVLNECLCPDEELGLLLYLTDSMLIRCRLGNVSLGEILGSDDGSTAVIGSSLIDFKKTIVPVGLARILADDLLGAT